MKKIGCLLLSSLLCLSLAPTNAFAEGAVPEMYGVREVVVAFAHFDDPRASDICGLSRQQVATVLEDSFKGSVVPFIPASEARPPVTGIFRLQLIPEISTYVDENLGCISWLSLAAENRISVPIPPVNVLRTVTAVYWRQNIKIASSQSTHIKKITEALQKMVTSFAQQYRIDQPPELPE